MTKLKVIILAKWQKNGQNCVLREREFIHKFWQPAWWSEFRAVQNKGKLTLQTTAREGSVCSTGQTGELA